MKFFLISLFAGFILTSCQSAPVVTDAPLKPETEPVAQDWESQPPISVKRALFDGSRQPIEMHANWLGMSLPAAPAKEVFETLRTQTGQELISRSEAHITVLSPPEFTAFKGLVSIDDINQLAKKMRIQNSDLKPVCLGRGRAKVDGKEESTYFIVVKSEKLLNLRSAIAELFVKRGGDGSAFRPEVFFPHATVGFTKIDLHAEQGILKDARSCLLPLSLN
jgi:hypothetical protein